MTHAELLAMLTKHRDDARRAYFATICLEPHKSRAYHQMAAAQAALDVADPQAGGTR